MDEKNNFQPEAPQYDPISKNTTDPRIDITPDGEPLTYSLASLHYRYAEHIGKRGFSNGLLRIEQQTFESYIEAYEENKRVGAMISKMESEARQKEQKIQATEDIRDVLQANIIRKKQEQDREEKEAARLKIGWKELQERFTTARSNFVNNGPAYGWIGTLLFIAAGIIFIVTDISILNAIAGGPLNMDKTEAAKFALGVAFLAIVLKPLVDRVFEKPYQRGNTVWMHGLLITVGLSTIILLGVMGGYRNDAYIAEKREQQLKDEIGVIEEQIGKGEYTGSYTELEQKQKALNEVREKFDNNKVMLIFIFSSILFAIAGAICFSIGVPAFRKHTNRIIEKNSLMWQIWRSHKRVAQADKNARFAENEWKIAEQKLPLLPNLTILEAELRRLILDIQVARAAQHQAHTAAVLAIYRDNYQRGERYIPSEEELAQFEVLLAEQNGIKSRNYQLNRQFSGSNLFNSQYLHEYIRQKIHKDNKSKNAQNGHVHHPNGFHK